MVRIRLFEEKVEELFLSGVLPGFVHLYIGEEAIASGVCSALKKSDYITSTHRGHGHVLAKGARMDRMMAELYGKKTGYCKGKGGSMHIFDFNLGVLGANGVVGGGFPIAVGAGLSAKLKRTDEVCVCFFGDGSSNRGTFHESLNMAAAWNLPVIYVCENNRYAATTPTHTTTSVNNIADRATGYGIPGVIVDGNNVEEVYSAAKNAIERARNGEGPTLIECKTYRIKGHFVGDPERYRSKDEVKEMKALDPIERYIKGLFDENVCTIEEVEEIYQGIRNEVIIAIKFAEGSPNPEPEDALTDLYVMEEGIYYA
ncbi:MAG: acetoin:2,6-dichlorophenolindophenol oxidoreductase subunit alpha [Clostridiaceae bacterium BRH_c20a]|nr:MAG: acetoin:2,6-dichlorophenolindophenol oxidoreductase subunit alpha [Clostridiaceae bacterium BRH_c20a]